MSNSLIINTLPPPLVAIARLKDYVEKKWHEDIKSVSPIHRYMLAEYLVGRLGFSRSQAGLLLGVSKATVHRDIQTYQFMLKKVKSRREELEKIHAYILYNAKWTHSK